MNSSIHTQLSGFTTHSDWYDIFLKHTNQKKLQLQTIKKGLKSYPVLWKQIIDPLYPLSLVYFGVGNGNTEIPLTVYIQNLRDNSENMFVYCEDPSIEMKDSFMKQSTKKRINKMIQIYSTKKFEDNTFIPSRGDIVTAMHSWYYISNWKDVPSESNSLRKFQRSIKPGGAGLIVMHSKLSDRYVLNREYTRKIHNAEEICAEEVISEIIKLKIQYTYNIVKSVTDISCCFRSNVFNPSKEGASLLSFLLRTKWNELNSSIQTNIGSEIMRLVGINGRQILFFRDTFIWITT